MIDFNITNSQDSYDLSDLIDTYSQLPENIEFSSENIKVVVSTQISNLK